MHYSTSGNFDGSYKVVKNFNKETVDYSIWEFAVAQNKTVHPAVFPYEIPYRHIKTWSNEGDTVLDPFAGSGTTMLAALDLNRKYIGFDISKEYVELTKKRIKEHEKSNC